MDLNAQVYYVPLSSIVMGKIEKGSKNTITSYFPMTCYNNPQIMNQNKLTLCNNREKSNIRDKKLHLHNKWPFFALFFFSIFASVRQSKKRIIKFLFSIHLKPEESGTMESVYLCKRKIVDSIHLGTCFAVKSDANGNREKLLSDYLMRLLRTPRLSLT